MEWPRAQCPVIGLCCRKGSPLRAGRADKLAAYLSTRFWDGEQLARAIDGKRVLAQGALEDYALLAQGLADWGVHRPNSGYSDLAQNLLAIAWRRYFRNNRWIESDSPLIPMLEGRIALEDGELPSATATVTRLSQQYVGLNKDREMQQRLDAHLSEVRAYLGDSVFWYASYVPLVESHQSLR